MGCNIKHDTTKFGRNVTFTDKVIIGQGCHSVENSLQCKPVKERINLK